MKGHMGGQTVNADKLYDWLITELQEIQRDKTRLDNRYTQVLLKLRRLQEGKSVE